MKNFFYGVPKIYCNCGSETLTIGENITKYCCSISPCSTEGDTITCKQGTVQNLNEKCQKECPIGKWNTHSEIAISTTEILPENACIENQNGTITNFRFKKVYLPDTSIISDEQFVEAFCGNAGGVACNSSHSGTVQYRQCLNRGRIIDSK